MTPRTLTTEAGRREWRPIETAPRDGTVVEIATLDEHPEGPFEMRWDRVGFNPLVQSEPGGIWKHPSGGFTWCEDHGFGPTHWRPAESIRP